jgi:hypothetical protein
MSHERGEARAGFVIAPGRGLPVHGAGAGAACAQRRHGPDRGLPFAAIGFASVVSMIPGVYLFRMMSGLAQILGGAAPSLPLISGTITDAMTACGIILAVCLGLIVPKLIIDEVGDRSIKTGTRRRVCGPEKPVQTNRRR